ATFKLTQLIWLLVGLLEAALALRFLFRLLGVNEANAFASFLYNLTDIFLAPFANLTGTPAAGSMVLEIPTLIAMAVYLLIGWALDRLIHVLFYRPATAVRTRQTVIDENIPPDEVVRRREYIPTTGREREDVLDEDVDEMDHMDMDHPDDADDIYRDEDDIDRPRNPL
ncbi:MAG: hypothetical protein AAGU05_16135, partial [Anaerolineaceae bacterium]